LYPSISSFFFFRRFTHFILQPHFKGVYAIATAIVTKRVQALEREKELEELLKEQDSFIHLDTGGKSTEEIIADIKKNLGITKNTDLKEAKNESNQ